MGRWLASEPATEPGSSQEDEPESSTQGGPYCSTCMPLGPKGASATLPRAVQGGKRPRESSGAAPGKAPAVHAEAGPGLDPGKVTGVGPALRRPKLKGEQRLKKKVPLCEDAARCVTIGATLSRKKESALIAFLQENSDVFAWEPSDLPGVPREVVEHNLAVCPGARHIQQRVRQQA